MGSQQLLSHHPFQILFRVTESGEGKTKKDRLLRCDASFLTSPKMHYLTLILYGLVSFISTAASAKTAFIPGPPRVHDDTFTPTHVLRISRKQFCVGGIIRYTTLVNDTLPGPELHIAEGKVVWIRVYNDMLDANLTMVGVNNKSS